MDDSNLDTNLDVGLGSEKTKDDLDCSNINTEYLGVSELCDIGGTSNENHGNLPSRSNSPINDDSFSESYDKSPDAIAVTDTNKDTSRYKHVSHREKPVQVVVKRNARERRRVQTVNSAFLSLRKHIPYEDRHKRLSKVKTLRIAIDYIRQLEQMLGDHDSVLDGLLGNSHVTTEEHEAVYDHALSQLIEPRPIQQFPEMKSARMTTSTNLDMISQLQLNSLTSNLFAGTGNLITSPKLPLSGRAINWGDGYADASLPELLLHN